MDSTKEHWNKFYLHNGKCRKNASPFCKWLVETYMQCFHGNILELGCGMGGDSRYLAENTNGIVVGMDISDSVINQNMVHPHNPQNLFFRCGDFTEDVGMHCFGMLYSRFTLHCLPFDKQLQLLKQSKYMLLDGGLLCIEVRSTNDPMCGIGEPAGYNAYINEHFRCFVDFKWIKKFLEDEGWYLCFADEHSGYSPFGDDNPTLIRIVAERPRYKHRWTS